MKKTSQIIIEEEKEEEVIENKIKVGDYVVPIKLVDANGQKIIQYDSKYKVLTIKDNTAVLYADRNGKLYLWAALTLDNIKKI